MSYTGTGKVRNLNILISSAPSVLYLSVIPLGLYMYIVTI